ncbi:MAG: carbohydrate kinase family protein, partial [Alphaproteobacteria bacterium]|nr:carbohydrate kinase family protein [Alphaproteobacteria bacterium]
GAGDAFASTFATWFTRTCDPAAALKAATLNAASVIMYADTQTGLLKDTEISQGLVENEAELTVSTWTLSPI